MRRLLVALLLVSAGSPAFGGALGAITQGASGASAIITIHAPPNITVFGPYNVGIICTISSGANLTYTVQVTGDPAPTANGNWNSHDTMQGLTANQNGNILFPVTGVRVNNTSYTSGSVTCGFANWP